MRTLTACGIIPLAACATLPEANRVQRAAAKAEAAEGILQNGEWVDFDPLAPSNVIR
jgi:hypothetical protein